MTHPLNPIREPYSPEIAAILNRYPTRDGYLLQLFRVFANSSRFLRKGVADLLDRDSPLSMRHREIVILRTTANCGCEYEWGVHVAGFADAVGFTRAEIEATRHGDRADFRSETESLLIQVVDELCRHRDLLEATLAMFQKQFDVAQQLEILALVGNYHTVSFVANVARLAPEPFAARFDRLEPEAALVN